MRYFFTIHGQDRVADDPESTYLPDEAAALSYTEYIIRELRKKSGYNDLALMMFVEDEARSDHFGIAVFPGLLSGPQMPAAYRRLGPSKNWTPVSPDWAKLSQ